MTNAMHAFSCRLLLALLALPLFGISGCSGEQSAVPAQPLQASATATTSVGGATVQASTMDVANLNPQVAARYGISRTNPGLILLVTVRDARGNAIEPGDLRMQASASALPDAPKALPLHPITTDQMTDYVGVFNATPPATVQFRISVVRNGARVEIATTGELYPR